jgi:hypothetical protein
VIGNPDHIDTSALCPLRDAIDRARENLDAHRIAVRTALNPLRDLFELPVAAPL